MDPISSLAASGMRARLESLEMIGNNLANAATDGYKADREFYNLFVSASAGPSAQATMPVVERPWTDFSQGTIRATGNPLHLALSGKGFFAVNGPNGPLYTRNGDFHVSSGGVIVTSDGYSLRGSEGNPIKVQNNRPIEIMSDGTVQQQGQSVGRIELANVRTAGKVGNNYFSSVAPLPADAVVQQGALESSNVGSAETAVRLVNVMRQFEMLQKAAGIGAEMSRRALEEVARVGS